MSEEFNEPAIERLKKFLQKNNQTEKIEQLTPDASTREFFRVAWNNNTAIACIYPEKFDDSLPQIDVTNLFLKSNLPVAKIYDVDYNNGLVLHEDFGDKILRDVLEKSSLDNRNVLLDKAISLIAKIQHSTYKAFELDSIASKLKFDTEKLLWELNFFKKHFFGSLMNKPIPKRDEKLLNKEFTELCNELEAYAKYLTHRDYHSANLMLDEFGNLRIIDHQDARIGSVAYDLVSLLLDRITETPSQDWLKMKKKFFISEREKLNLEKISFEKFDYEFELVTVQRCLKAIGTFSNQAANFGKDRFIEYIDPMFEVVLKACVRINRFPHLQNTIKDIIG